MKKIKRCLRNKYLMLLILLSILSIVTLVVRCSVDKPHEKDLIPAFAFFFLWYVSSLASKEIERENREKEENVDKYWKKKNMVCGRVIETLKEEQRSKVRIAKSIERYNKKIQKKNSADYS